MRARSAVSVALFAVTIRLFAESQTAPMASGASAVALLDRYLLGDYDGTVEVLQTRPDFGALLDGLRRDGPGWIAAGGPGQEQRRELTAVTVALEAAREGAWQEWKLLTRIPRPSENPRLKPLPDVLSLYWQAPPLLLEWACELIRQGHQPRHIERQWWLASLAVAERAQDYEFLVGDARPPLDYNTTPIQHVRHAQLRFPDEPRFKLAQGIAEEQHTPGVARRVFESLRDDVDLRGEAVTRLGVMAASQGDHARALDLFKQVESLTRDPWVLYLARFSAGQIFTRRNKSADAERAYRRALETIPLAQSASVALATLLFRDGRRHEAGGLIDAMLAADPPPTDPWRGYADADDRFWPRLIRQLRAEIRR